MIDTTNQKGKLKTDLKIEFIEVMLSNLTKAYLRNYI